MEAKIGQKKFIKNPIKGTKFTIAISCLIFFFIGAPLGAIIRKGGFGYPFIITLL